MVVKRGRKPSGKIHQEHKVILASIPLDLKDINEILGVKEVGHAKITNKIQLSVDNEDMSDELVKKDKEITKLKSELNELKSKYMKIKHLEDVVSDDGAFTKNQIILKNVVGKSETNQLCYWCCHPFHNVPISLPEYYDTKKEQFRSFGCFCSFNCAHAFNINMDDHKVWERHSLLLKYKNMVFNGDPSSSTITPAPSRHILKVFGGNKTIEQFRKANVAIPKKYIVNIPPTIPFFTVIEEIPKYYSKFQETQKPHRYSIARKKPLPQQSALINSLFS